MHIAPFDNQNSPIVDRDDSVTPLVYFNIVKLQAGESHVSEVSGYETCIVPATGTVHVQVGEWQADDVGGRGEDVWDGEPNAVYVPVGAKAEITAVDACEIFIAGAKFDEVYEPFVVRAEHIDPVQYGSDDTKTHRKIKHLLGQNPPGKVGRLLISELYTVGAGGWSGFPPHKHDTDRLPDESHHDEVYNFRFRPGHGFGMQLLQREDGAVGEAYHIVDGSTLQIDKGYHPCVAAPGYEMYYFTILAGASQRSLVQFFQPTHAYQVETIPGIKDMVAKFK
ncbi:MAG: 5-deoxy-glucuronate isomerase [Alphaproteobacteria bacterium]